jgi:Protein of unknown function (DUF3800)
MAREPPDPALLHDIYIDESSQTKHRYLVLGGLIVPTSSVPGLLDGIARARLPELPQGELAWTKVSKTKLLAYRRVANTILTQVMTIPGAQFHTLIVDTSKLKDATFNSGSRDVGFNKEIYQLCQKFGRTNRSGLFHVYLDRRNTASSTEELRDILNHGIRRKQPDRDWPFRRVHFRDSHTCPPLQAVDVLLGAVAFHLNGHYAVPDASPAKKLLSDHISGVAGIRDVAHDTPRLARVTIWHRQLR